jgi:hypothetical protein
MHVSQDSLMQENTLSISSSFTIIINNKKSNMLYDYRMENN